MRPLARRHAVAAALAAALLALATGPAAPASAVTSAYSSTVRTFGELPVNGWSTGSNCTTSPTYAFTEGPGTAPAGIGSYTVTTTAGGGAARIELPLYGLRVGALSNVTAMHSVTSPAGEFVTSGFGTVLLTMQDPATPDAWTYLSVAGGAAGAGWSLIDVLHSQVTVVTLDKITGAVVTPSATTTWGQFRASNPDVTVIGGSLLTTCVVAATVSWDDVVIAASGLETHYDLEPKPAVDVATTVSATAITYGSAATVAATVLHDSDAAPLAGAVVELWATPYGAASATRIATATTSAAGKASATVRPTARTTYQWRAVTEAFTTVDLGAAVAVSARPKLTINAVDATVTSSTPVYLHGVVRPTLMGSTVSLKRTGSTTILATATVRSDGSWAITRLLPKGTYGLYALVPATPGLLKGASPTLTVKVG